MALKTIELLAAETGLSPKSIRYILDKRLVPKYKLGTSPKNGRVMIDKDEFEAWVKQSNMKGLEQGEVPSRSTSATTGSAVERLYQLSQAPVT